MFRFAELLVIVVMLWLIANLVRYLFCKVGGFSSAGSNFLFGLSDSWLAHDEKKINNDIKEKTSKKGKI